MPVWKLVVSKKRQTNPRVLLYLCISALVAVPGGEDGDESRAFSWLLQEVYFTVITIVSMTSPTAGTTGVCCGSRKVIPFTTSIPSTT